MNTIKMFKINKLYNKYNASIEFMNGKRIVVAENGMGKTTILKAFYYCITRNKDSLKKIDFTKISIEFDDNRKVEIYRNALRKSANITSLITNVFTEKEILKMKEMIQNDEDLRKSKYVNKIRNIGISYRRFESILEDLNINEISDETDFNATREAFKIIEERVDIKKVLYLPTYRRIEDSLESNNNVIKEIGYIDGKSKYIFSDNSRESDIEKNINYGVHDVKMRFELIQKSISKLSMDAMNNISKDFFEDFLTDKINSEAVSDKKEYINFINKINTLSEQQKIDLKNKIDNSGQDGIDIIFAFFLNKLQINYKPIERKEKIIQNFINVCNEYFKPRKEVIYDTLNAHLSIKDNETDREIDPEYLSSGEKQIIGLFSKIYLEDIDEYYIIFDEPELSLSIEWQQKLIPHIIKSGKCNVLFAATHSPFIFENECDEYTESLNIYLEESSNER
ncbi:hypothetical protein DVV91_10615 [Clostridium botulinum]|uniref:AAA family ATPase n=1 Tax=Clostridium botulinum TaxID=1491 RepID=UPI0007743FA0|nr:AAA family ATPase [Clostridium botulinum]MBN1074793.1 hypothetical protein [Clostridium botulinum]NFL87395.1 hypothetical protein [Clostridium botulinum]NFO21732.1 hypothetical protein [Clostridium botulinum]